MKLFLYVYLNAHFIILLSTLNVQSSARAVLQHIGSQGLAVYAHLYCCFGTESTRRW